MDACRNFRVLAGSDFIEILRKQTETDWKFLTNREVYTKACEGRESTTYPDVDPISEIVVVSTCDDYKLMTAHSHHPPTEEIAGFIRKIGEKVVLLVGSCCGVSDATIYKLREMVWPQMVLVGGGLNTHPIEEKAIELAEQLRRQGRIGKLTYA